MFDCHVYSWQTLIVGISYLDTMNVGFLNYYDTTVIGSSSDFSLSLRFSTSNLLESDFNYYIEFSI